VWFTAALGFPVGAHGALRDVVGPRGIRDGYDPEVLAVREERVMLDLEHAAVAGEMPAGRNGSVLLAGNGPPHRDPRHPPDSRSHAAVRGSNPG
jgi:hypothetical protein